MALKDIVFDPATTTFTLNFVRGGSARLTMAVLDQDHMAIDVTYDGPMADGLPFAAMRSMYATEINADVAKVAWRTMGGKGLERGPHHGLEGRGERRGLGRPHGGVASQHERAGHGVRTLLAPARAFREACCEALSKGFSVRGQSRARGARP